MMKVARLLLHPSPHQAQADVLQHPEGRSITPRLQVRTRQRTRNRADPDCACLCACVREFCAMLKPRVYAC